MNKENTEYAILRIAKLNHWSKVSLADGHNRRLRDVPNADKAQGYKNKLVYGSGSLKDSIKARYAEAEVAPKRKDAVLAVEMLLTASPEAFQRQDFDLDEWIETNANWLKAKYGKNLIQAVYHGDESTPHIHAMLTPIVVDTKTNKNKLNCKLFTGEAEGLKQLQTEYASVVAKHGLERGIPKSKAKHQTIKHFYSTLVKSKGDVDGLGLPLMPHPSKMKREDMDQENRKYRSAMKKIMADLMTQIELLIKSLRDKQWELLNMEKAKDFWKGAYEDIHEKAYRLEELERLEPQELKRLEQSAKDKAKEQGQERMPLEIDCLAVFDFSEPSKPLPDRWAEKPTDRHTETKNHRVNHFKRTI